MKTYRRLCRKPIKINDANIILNECKKKLWHFTYGPYISKMYNTVFVDIKQRFCHITLWYEGHMVTYVADMGEDDYIEAARQCNAGLSAYMRMRRNLTPEQNKLVPNIVPEDDMQNGKNFKPFSIGPLMFKRDEYDGKEVHAYSYDLNSAYAWAMLQPIPDTRNIRSIHNLWEWNKGIVQKGEIGFSLEGELLEEGEFALYRFKALESPFVKFIKTYYDKKKNAKNRIDMQIAKDALNLPTGYFQRINPFVRSAIVGRCKNLMRSLIDDNTIYANTDSIVSLVPREDLNLGNEIGEWKNDHEGNFRMKGFAYQWTGEKPKYRGVSKYLFEDSYNLLTDEIPIIYNKYSYSIDKNQFVKENL